MIRQDLTSKVAFDQRPGKGRLIPADIWGNAKTLGLEQA